MSPAFHLVAVRQCVATTAESNGAGREGEGKNQEEKKTQLLQWAASAAEEEGTMIHGQR